MTAPLTQRFLVIVDQHKSFFRVLMGKTKGGKGNSRRWHLMQGFQTICLMTF